jgi:1-aminocyclopropane-1-carboxylate deaminase
MNKENWINDKELIITPWQNGIFSTKKIAVFILRLDLLHPVVSGNKWIKLKNFIRQMNISNKAGILTQGGPWSNHIVAVAAACKELGVQSAALLKGNEKMTASLEEAQSYGMELIWVDWNDYNNPDCYNAIAAEKNLYFVPMGGMGKLGSAGFTELIQREQFKEFDHIAAAVGSGTMFSGILLGKDKQQKATGISALRLRPSTLETIKSLSSTQLLDGCFITDRFVRKGYAKADDSLIGWMNDFHKQTNIPTDMVYTAKTFMALETLAQENYFETGENVLVIHSGGLQGNRSLPADTLIF